METLKLISEEIQDVEYITEQKEGGKKDYKLKGIFMQADIKNRNGRIYPEEVLAKEVKRYNKETPIKIPNKPPRIHKRTASIMNCIIIDF